jgi:hypothetical protein
LKLITPLAAIAVAVPQFIENELGIKNFLGNNRSFCNFSYTPIPMLRYPIALIFVCCAVFGCSKKQETVWQYSYPGFSLPADVACAPFTLDSLPFTIGNSWSYKVVQQKLLPMDSVAFPAGYATSVFIDSFECTVTVVGDTLVETGASHNFIRFVKMHSSVSLAGVEPIFSLHPPDALTSIYGGPSGDYYYAITSRGVYSTKVFADPDATNWGTLMSDTTDLHLKFPVVLNESWYYAPVPEIPGKAWQGYYTVNTPAGSFSCVKLSESVIGSDGYHSYQTLQYYGSKGLIQQMQVAYIAPNGRPYTRPHNRVSRKFTLISTNF